MTKNKKGEGRGGSGLSTSPRAPGTFLGYCGKRAVHKVRLPGHIKHNQEID